MAKPRERKHLFALLCVLLGLSVIALLVATAQLRAPLWVIVLTALVCGGTQVLLMTHRDTLGKELHYLDLWSVPHFLVGPLLWMTGVELHWLIILTIGWEGIELASAVREHKSNRVVDVLLAVAGWYAASAVF